jgi:hypothetical protein
LEIAPIKTHDSTFFHNMLVSSEKISQNQISKPVVQLPPSPVDTPATSAATNFTFSSDPASQKLQVCPNEILKSRLTGALVSRLSSGPIEVAPIETTTIMKQELQPITAPSYTDLSCYDQAEFCRQNSEFQSSLGLGNRNGGCLRQLSQSIKRQSTTLSSILRSLPGYDEQELFIDEDFDQNAFASAE